MLVNRCKALSKCPFCRYASILINLLYESESLFKFLYLGHDNPVHIIVGSYYCGGSKYTHDATKDGIVIGIKVII